MTQSESRATHTCLTQGISGILLSCAPQTRIKRTICVRVSFSGGGGGVSQVHGDDLALRSDGTGVYTSVIEASKSPSRI